MVKYLLIRETGEVGDKRVDEFESRGELEAELNMDNPDPLECKVFEIAREFVIERIRLKVVKGGDKE